MYLELEMVLLYFPVERLVELGLRQPSIRVEFTTRFWLDEINPKVLSQSRREHFEVIGYERD